MYILGTKNRDGTIDFDEPVETFDTYAAAYEVASRWARTYSNSKVYIFQAKIILEAELPVEPPLKVTMIEAK